MHRWSPTKTTGWLKPSNALTARVEAPKRAADNSGAVHREDFTGNGRQSRLTRLRNAGE
jgi:hypothetical protein